MISTKKIIKESNNLIDLDITSKDNYGTWKHYIDTDTKELISKSFGGLTNTRDIVDIIPDFETFYNGKIDSDVIDAIKDNLTYNPLEESKSIERKRVIQEEVNQRMVDDFQIKFCPYGYGDIEAALNVIEESEVSDTYPPDFLYDEIERFKDETGTEDLTDIDSVALMYDLILQTARGEIEEKTGFDLENDSIASTSIYVAENYLATRYNYSEDAVIELKEKLDENTLTKEDFSKPTQWFLDEIGL